MCVTFVSTNVTHTSCMGMKHTLCADSNVKPNLLATVHKFIAFFISTVFLSTPQRFSPGESDPTGPALFLRVLLYADLTGEEMFCLILKCEEICGRPAKSHYSPPCSAVLHEASPRTSKKHGRQRKKICILPQTDKRLRFQVQSS